MNRYVFPAFQRPGGDDPSLENIAVAPYATRINDKAKQQKALLDQRRKNTNGTTKIHETLSFYRDGNDGDLITLELLDTPIGYGRYSAVWDVKHDSESESGLKMDWCVKELYHHPLEDRPYTLDELVETARIEHRAASIAYVSQTDALLRKSGWKSGRNRRNVLPVNPADHIFVACPKAVHAKYLVMERLYGESYVETPREIERVHRDETPEFHLNLKRGLVHQFDRKFREMFTVCKMFHWDLHPGNVYLCSGNRLFFLDFGRVETDVHPDIVKAVESDPNLFVLNVFDTNRRVNEIKQRVATARTLGVVLDADGNAMLGPKPTNGRRAPLSTSPQSPPDPATASSHPPSSTTTATAAVAAVATGFGMMMMSGIGYTLYQRMIDGRSKGFLFL